MKITETTLKQLIREQLQLMEKINILDPKPGEKAAAARAKRAMKKRMASTRPDFDAIRAELAASGEAPDTGAGIDIADLKKRAGKMRDVVARANKRKAAQKKALAPQRAADSILPDAEIAKLTKPLPGDKDKAVANPELDELQLEEDGSVDESHCPGDRDELEEAEIQNPGKYKTGMKAGYDKDGDGVPDGADEDPKDGAIQEGEESLEEDEQNEGLGKKVGTHDGKPVRQIGSKKPADTHPAYDTPQADRARRGKGKLTVQKEDWTKKNKDQLLFERLIEKWIK